MTVIRSGVIHRTTTNRKYSSSSSVIVSSSNTPEVCAPAAEDQQHTRAEGCQREPLVFLAILFVEATPLLLEALSSGYSLLACPLQMAQINCHPRSDSEHQRHKHRCTSENGVNDDHMIVRIVVAVLNDTCDYSNDNVHATGEVRDELFHVVA